MSNNAPKSEIPAIWERFTAGRRIRRLIKTPLYKNSFFLIADSLVSSFFGFIFWVAAARFYSEVNVGLASAVISAFNLLSALATLGLNLSIIRFLPSATNPRILINSAINLVGLIAFLAGCIFVAGLSFWSPSLVYLRQNVGLLVIFLLTVPFYTILDLIDSVFIARRASQLVVFTTFILAISKIGLLIILAFFMKNWGIISSWGLALMITLLVSFLWLLPRVQSGYKLAPQIDFALLKGLSSYAAGSYIASLLTQISSMLLPLLVLNVLGAQINAYFYVAWTIAGFISAIPLATSRSLFAEGANSLQNIRHNIIKSLKFTFLISIPVFILIGLAAKWILLAFGPGYSANAVTLVWLLSLANVIRGLYTIYIGFLRIQDKMKELMIIQGATNIIFLIASYWAAKAFGLMGIGYIWLSAQILIAAILGIRLTLQLRKLNRSETI